jgi:hypothetical protein
MGDTDESRSARLYQMARDERSWVVLAKHLEIDDPETVRWALEQTAWDFENKDPEVRRQGARRPAPQK